MLFLKSWSAMQPEQPVVAMGSTAAEHPQGAAIQELLPVKELK